MFKTANILQSICALFFLAFLFSFFKKTESRTPWGRLIDSTKECAVEVGKFLDMEGAEIIRRPRTGLMRGAKAPTVYWDSLGLVGI
jgi:hypothetical protein